MKHYLIGLLPGLLIGAITAASFYFGYWALGIVSLIPTFGIIVYWPTTVFGVGSAFAGTSISYYGTNEWAATLYAIGCIFCYTMFVYGKWVHR